MVCRGWRARMFGLALAWVGVALGVTTALPARGEVLRLRPETVASGLEHPWAVAFLPDGRFLVTERPGRLRIVEADGRLGEPLAGLPRVDAVGQGGLLDLVLDRDFARNRTLYFCYAEPEDRKSVV